MISGCVSCPSHEGCSISLRSENGYGPEGRGQRTERVAVFVAVFVSGGSDCLDLGRLFLVIDK
jgi:hypothetical protein